MAEPSDEQLAAYLTSNAERFRSEDRLTFSHVYLSAARRDALERDAESVAAKLANIARKQMQRRWAITSCSATSSAIWPAATLAAHSASASLKSFSTWNRSAGRDRSRRATGCISSASASASQGGLLPLDAVRQAVRREWMNARRLEAEQKLYRTLRERYEIVVETPPRQAGRFPS